MRTLTGRPALVFICLFWAVSLLAQPTQPSTTTTPAAVDRLFRISGIFQPADGLAAAPVENVRFAIYAQELGGIPLWQETQIVAVDSEGRYSVLLGSTNSEGLPVELFATGEPRWLGMQFQRPGETEQARSLATSVPYALMAARAVDAETLGGRPASAYQLAALAMGAGAAPVVGGGGAGTTTATHAVDAGTTTSVQLAGVTPKVSTGTLNFIGKFTNATDLTSSALFESAGQIGLGTTTPQDFLHARFTDNVGQFTGYAVQNLSAAATAYSGMLFFDQNGALGQFQGFNNSTHEYRINNIASGGTINFMLGSTSKFKVAAGGNIGIGTTNPLGVLEVISGTQDAGDIEVAGYGCCVPALYGRKAQGTIGAPTAVQSGDVIAFFGGRGYKATGFGDAAAGMDFFATENWTDAATGAAIRFSTAPNGTIAATERMRINHDGRVGIGTLTPTRAKVEIVGFVSSTIPGTNGQYGQTPPGTTFVSQPIAYSLFADQNIAASSFIAFSDERIKRIDGRSDAARDLATLAGIEVTDYAYIDTVTKGTGKQKKVIAQQVEKVYPQAVSRIADVVPDIYQKAPVKDGWVKLATNLKKGERVRLIGNKKEGIHEVLEVAPGRFRTDFAADGDAVFVFGREVKDFRMVDYEAIAMLNVSATQELNRRLEKQAAEFAAQAVEMNRQTTRIAELEEYRQAQSTRIATLEKQASEIAALKQQMAELQVAGLAAGRLEAVKLAVAR